MPRTQLVLDSVIGLVARLVLALTTSYRVVDADLFGGWAQAMHDHPLGDFYASAPTPDHLPGDLWVLKAVEVGYSAAGGTDFFSGTFELITNVVPMIADVVVGVLVFYIVRLWGSEQAAARAARWYLLNPAVIVVAGAWGQWNAIAIAALLGGILLVLRDGWSWIWSAPLLTWAVLTGPQLGVPVLIVLMWVLLRPDSLIRGPHRASTLRVAAAVGAFCALAVATALALLEPFRVGLAWTPDQGSTLLDRLQYATDLHRFTTMGAANIWLVIDRSVIGPADDVVRWSGVTPSAIGVGLVAILWLVLAFTAPRVYPPARRLESLTWAAAMALFAACLVLTRVHERYYFPVLVLLLLWTAVRGFDRDSVVLFWAFSALFVIGLVLPMGWTGQDERLLHHPAARVVVGMLHIAFFVVLLVLPWRRVRRA